jgi:hypothetical protein
MLQQGDNYMTENSLLWKVKPETLQQRLAYTLKMTMTGIALSYP